MESIHDWMLRTQERSAQEAAALLKNGHLENSMENSSGTRPDIHNDKDEDSAGAMDTTA